MVLLDEKRFYRETELKKKTLFNITSDRHFFTKSTWDSYFPSVLLGWLVDPSPPGWLLEDSEFT